MHLLDIWYFFVHFLCYVMYSLYSFHSSRVFITLLEVWSLKSFWGMIFFLVWRVHWKHLHLLRMFTFVFVYKWILFFFFDKCFEQTDKTDKKGWVLRSIFFFFEECDWVSFCIIQLQWSWFDYLILQSHFKPDISVVYLKLHLHSGGFTRSTVRASSMWWIDWISGLV